MTLSTLEQKAILAAISAGICPDKEYQGKPGAYDGEKFFLFWSRFEDDLLEYLRDNSNDPGKMLNDKTEKEITERNRYRDLILHSVTAFFVGIILMALMKALGLGGLIFGFLLFVLGALYFKF